MGCAEANSRVYYSTSENASRKYPHTWELVESALDHLICVNTTRVNRIVEEALNNAWIEPLSDVHEWRSEVAIPDESGRFDFGSGDVYLEVKSVTYLREGIGVFPDAVSVRARKHVDALTRQAQNGNRAVLVLCAPHSGIAQIGIARDIDPSYAESVAHAIDQGVEVICLGCQVSPDEVVVNRELPFVP